MRALELWRLHDTLSINEAALIAVGVDHYRWVVLDIATFAKYTDKVFFCQQMGIP